MADITPPPGYSLDQPIQPPPGYKLDGPESPGALEQIGTSLHHQAKSIFDSLAGLMDTHTAQRVGDAALDAQIEQWHKAKAEYAQGNYVNAARRGLAAAVPFIGPLIENTAEKATTGGRPIEAATDILAPVALGAAVKYAPEIGEAASEATGATVRGASHVLPVAKAAAKAGAKDVAVGGAKAGAGYYLATRGPMGELGDAIAGVPLAKSGIQQAARGLKAGWKAGKDTLAQRIQAAADAQRPSETPGPSATVTREPDIQPEPLPASRQLGPAGPPQPLPVSQQVEANRPPIVTQAPEDTSGIIPNWQPTILKREPAPEARQLPAAQTPIITEPPPDSSGVIPGWKPTILEKEAQPTPAGAAPPEWEGAYPVERPPLAEGEQPRGAPPKEQYQQAARTVKARALARFLNVGGIPYEDAVNMTPEHWKMAAEGAGVNTPSESSIKLTLAELKKLNPVSPAAEQLSKAVKPQPRLVKKAAKPAPPPPSVAEKIGDQLMQ